MKQLRLLFLVLLFLTPLFLLAQDDPENSEDYIALFDSLPGIVLLMSIVTPLLTNAINSLVKLSGKAVQILSWVTGILLSLVGYYFNLGMFSEVEIWQALLIGLGAGLISNGLFDIGLVKSILKMVGAKKVNNKPIEKAK